MSRLLIDERSAGDRFERVELEVDRDVVAMYVDNTRFGELPIEAVVGVMKRYGKPLEQDVIVPRGSGLALGDGVELVMLRFLARYDVIARDWLVLVTPDETLGEMAVTVTPALEHLARAYRRNTVTQAT